MYTGILVQYDRDYKDILAVDLIDGTTTSWFASKFTDPKQYLNIVTQTKALFTGDFDELAKLENWGTIGNFGAQVGDLFTADIPELERLQSNTTNVQLSQYAYSADYHIGGWLSLIVDAGKVVLSTVPSDQLKKDAKKDLRFRVLKEVLTNEVIVADIRGLLAENKVSDAVIKAMLEIGMSVFRNADLFISNQAIETVKASIILELELKYGIKVVETGLKGLNLVGSTLEGLQKLANFLDAGGLAVSYYFGDDFTGEASHITFKGIDADRLEFRKMDTLKTGDKWPWHSPERNLAIMIKPTTDSYKASNGYVCRDYDYQLFFADDGSNKIIRDEVLCRGNDGIWVDEDDVGKPNEVSVNSQAKPQEITPRITAISAGGYHTCALTSGGGVKCWGQNEYGELGDGTTTNSSIPVKVIGLDSGVQAISAGDENTCALTSSGGVKCWGQNKYGGLGDDTKDNSSIPVKVIGLDSEVQAISAGKYNTCALTTNGSVKCWGSNFNGQLGNGVRDDSLIPVDVIGLDSNNVQAISVGSNYACALTNIGGVKCWGRNYEGQLGDGTAPNMSSIPVDVSDLTSDVQAISSASRHACAITTSGDMKCWGHNYIGLLGDGVNGTPKSYSSTPVDVIGLNSSVKDISISGVNTCALTTSGRVKCWGGNLWGGLGDGTENNSLTPVNVIGLDSNVQAISTGGFYTCVLIDNGSVKCWGRNSEGQLGDGTTTYSLVPVDVKWDK